MRVFRGEVNKYGGSHWSSFLADGNVYAFSGAAENLDESDERKRL